MNTELLVGKGKQRAPSEREDAASDFRSLCQYFRNQMGWSQEVLAKIAGTSRGNIALWEKRVDGKPIGPKSATRLANALRLHGVERGRFLSAAAATTKTGKHALRNASAMSELLTVVLAPFRTHGHQVKDFKSRGGAALTEPTFEVVTATGEKFPMECKHIEAQSPGELWQKLVTASLGEWESTPRVFLFTVYLNAHTSIAAMDPSHLNELQLPVPKWDPEAGSGSVVSKPKPRLRE